MFQQRRALAGEQLDVFLDLPVLKLSIGSLVEATSVPILHSHQVTHVINLCSERYNNLVPDVKYLYFDLRDDPTEPIIEALPVSVSFVQRAVAEGQGADGGAGGGGDGRRRPHVFVHCAAGSSRSGTVAWALLLAPALTAEGAPPTFHDPLRALSALQLARPVVAPNPGFVRQLHGWREEEGRLGAERDEFEGVMARLGFAAAIAAPRIPGVPLYLTDDLACGAGATAPAPRVAAEAQARRLVAWAAARPQWPGMQGAEAAEWVMRAAEANPSRFQLSWTILCIAGAREEAEGKKLKGCAESALAELRKPEVLQEARIDVPMIEELLHTMAAVATG